MILMLNTQPEPTFNQEYEAMSTEISKRGIDT